MAVGDDTFDMAIARCDSGFDSMITTDEKETSTTEFRTKRDNGPGQSCATMQALMVLSYAAREQHVWAREVEEHIAKDQLIYKLVDHVLGGN